jgi:hypothetical protein
MHIYENHSFLFAGKRDAFNKILVSAAADSLNSGVNTSSSGKAKLKLQPVYSCFVGHER